jgi:hypothetical protein
MALELLGGFPSADAPAEGFQTAPSAGAFCIQSAISFEGSYRTDADREEIVMARYYLDIHDGERFVHDDQGSEFDSPNAAVQGAARSAAETGQSRLVRGDTGDIVIEVRDEHHQQVCTVTASLRIERQGYGTPTEQARRLPGSKAKSAQAGCLFVLGQPSLNALQLLQLRMQITVENAHRSLCNRLHKPSLCSFANAAFGKVSEAMTVSR